MSLVLKAFGLWNWITNLYLWTYSLSKRYIRAIADAHIEEVYCFLDAGLPLVTRIPPAATLCIYTPATKVFSLDMTTVGGRKYRYNLLSARLTGATTLDLTEFFAEVTWTGAILGPTASQAIIAALLDRSTPLPLSSLRAYCLEVEDDTGTTHRLTDLSQPSGV